MDTLYKKNKKKVNLKQQIEVRLKVLERKRKYEDDKRMNAKGNGFLPLHKLAIFNM